MGALAERLIAFLDAAGDAASVRVASAKGSTPREAGTWMLVSRDSIFGTIGGGQLEYMAIDKARSMLSRKNEQSTLLDIPLGPEIGQCCGGRVQLVVDHVDAESRAKLIADAEAESAALPDVYVFGSGHVGHALAAGARTVPDFLIGAHAMMQCDALITRDAGFYRDYFKGLKLIVPKA